MTPFPSIAYCLPSRNFAVLCRLVPPLVKMFLARQRRAVLAGPRQCRHGTWRPPRRRPGSRGLAGDRRHAGRSRAGARRQGTNGDGRRSRTVTLPWGFTLAEVGVPASIWHGTADPAIFPDKAEHLAQVMRRASLTMLPGGGHLPLFTHCAAR